jgi:hypothetical protein
LANNGQKISRGYLWAELMRRTFGIDVLDCPRCGGRLRLLALIEHARVVERILRHLGLPTDRAEPQPARAPPRRAWRYYHPNDKWEPPAGAAKYWSK